MTEGKFTLSDVHKTYKEKDAWWTVLLVDPIASRLIVPVANYTNITPNQISIVSFILGVIAACNFYIGSSAALITGAILYHVSFILDCMDGKIARLKGTGSMFGVLLDIILDHIRVILCGIALSVGQFQLTGDHTFLLLAMLFIFVYFFRHYNALSQYKLRQQMQEKIRQASTQRNQAEEALIRAQSLNIVDWIDDDHLAAPMRDNPERARHVFMATEEKVQKAIEGRTTDGTGAETKGDPRHGFKSKFPWLMKVQAALLKKRIRMYLFSGIELQMFTFIIAPILGLIPEFMLFGSVLLLLFELAAIYKLWLSTKDFEKELAEIQNG